MIEDYQICSIAGRNILKGVTTIYEIIHHCKKTRSSGYLLKLDFERAYDIVDWDCLLEVLQLRGFGERWITWIEKRLASAKT